MAMLLRQGDTQYDTVACGSGMARQSTSIGAHLDGVLAGRGLASQ